MGLLKAMGLLVLIASPLFLDEIDRTFRWYFDYVPCPEGERFELVGPFPANGGSSFLAEAPSLEAVSVKYAAVKMDYVSSLDWHPSAPPTLAQLIGSAFKVSGK
jgi:hypothetical protein